MPPNLANHLHIAVVSCPSLARGALEIYFPPTPNSHANRAVIDRGAAMSVQLDTITARLDNMDGRITADFQNMNIRLTGKFAFMKKLYILLTLGVEAVN